MERKRVHCFEFKNYEGLLPQDAAEIVNTRLEEMGLDADNLISIVTTNGEIWVVFYKK